MFKKISLVIPIVSLLLSIGFVTPIKAAQFVDTDYTLEQTELVSENLYIAGGTVDIKGVVDGDVFVASDNLYISGTITGDLYAMGNKVNMSGTVYGNALLMSQYLDVSGSIGKNLIEMSMFSNNSSSIGSDLLVFAYNTNLTGKVTDDLRVFAQTALIDSEVKGELLLYASDSNVAEEKITGEIYENVEFVHEIEKPEITVEPKVARGRFMGMNIFSSLIGFVGLYILGIALIYVAPVKTLKIEKKVNESFTQFLYSFLIGLAISVVIPLPLIVLSFTLVGFPLALVTTMVLLFIYLYGKLWVESAIGNTILQKSGKEDNRRFFSLLIGRGISTVVNLIPIVRGIYGWVLGITAIGAVVRMKYDCFKTKPVKKVKTKK